MRLAAFCRPLHARGPNRALHIFVPCVSQGYKFNIFYPELIDKTVAPTYKVDKDPTSDDGEFPRRRITSWFRVWLRCPARQVHK